ncbi:MAG: helix-turn-helix transcriptional regulator [Tildeniella nuda ZEHNDER 1965/U140]|jgi:DNA-binding Xre family transcriptional regulator|nr:helix-turn-helix transcriptional regulator [Tildeniella nuda ZEHNDER 1965/U140]
MSKDRHNSESQFMTFLQERNVTPEQVIDVLGVTPRAFFYWTSGQREPRFTIQQIQDLCNLLGCSVHDLPLNFGRIQTKNAET